jgi:hypothetical protein
MRLMIYIFLFVLGLSCDQSQKEEKQSSANAKATNRHSSLLSKYKDKSFDTLRVYSPEELTGEYKGVQLDSADAVLFPEDIAQQHFSDPPGLLIITRSV